ncbi:MAG: hypothetical protein GF350_15060, partial [Chitinivibrionales bacterium]|nr:hypothetical protein [Chitinivibrionales bacterium]
MAINPLPQAEINAVIEGCFQGDRELNWNRIEQSVMAQVGKEHSARNEGHRTRILSVLRNFMDSFRVFSPAAATAGVLMLLFTMVPFGFSARFVQVSGSVSGHKETSVDGRAVVTKGNVLSKNIQYDVDGSSLAVVDIDKKVLAAFAGGSRMKLSEMDRTMQELHLSQGCVLVDLEKVTKRKRFAVTTPHAVCEARKTVFQVDAVGSENDKGGTVVSVSEGAVQVKTLENPAQIYLCRAGASVIAVGDSLIVQK